MRSSVRYSVKIKSSAAKTLKKIRGSAQARLIEAIDQQAESPNAGSALKGEFSGLRRIRVGDYRIIYEVDNGILTVLVLRVAHRREVYR